MLDRHVAASSIEISRFTIIFIILSLTVSLKYIYIYIDWVVGHAIKTANQIVAYFGDPQTKSSNNVFISTISCEKNEIGNKKNVK